MKFNKTDVERGLVSREEYFRQVAESCGILVVSQAIVTAVAMKDRKLSNIPVEHWMSLAMSHKPTIERELESRGDVFTLRSGVGVVFCAALKTYDMLLESVVESSAEGG